MKNNKANYNLFESQLHDAVAKYRGLKICEGNDGSKYLKGLLSLYDDSKFIDCYNIKIDYNEGFPKRFPKLYEIGGDIPTSAAYHKYYDNSCCITVRYDEILKCYDGITVLQFIDYHVIPYFANQTHIKKTGTYLNEYSHGKDGENEFLAELMKTNDKGKQDEYWSIVNGEKKYIQ